MPTPSILVEGAREHNLKNITLRIPHNTLTVVTGLSGSGKSSLAFDTLYAEGQRKYVQSLSAYARQFLDRLQKPDVDRIEGLSPAIAIEQRTASANPRSIVATSTEIHDYLRLLFASVGHQFCPRCNQPIQPQSAEEIVRQILRSNPSNSPLILLAPLLDGRKGAALDLFEHARRNGFLRVRVDGRFLELDPPPKLNPNHPHTIDLVVDRLRLSPTIQSRLTDSVELALKCGSGILKTLAGPLGTPPDSWTQTLYSEKNACPHCHLSFETLEARHFSFNSPYGACPVCNGLGIMQVFDETRVIPDPSLSLASGAIRAWRSSGRHEAIYRRMLLRSLAAHYHFDLQTPWQNLPQTTRAAILHGSGTTPIRFGAWRGARWKPYSKPFEGVLPNLTRRFSETHSTAMRAWLASFTSSRPCSACHGHRLKPESLACRIASRNIIDLMSLTARQALDFFSSLSLPAPESLVASEILREIQRRLLFLCNVGLDYLSLDRPSASLSGGEAQRIRLATQVGAGLVGVLYVLDEPSIGLHPRDTQRLLQTLRELRDAGNTVVVVEHDEQTIRQADYVVDLGPYAGVNGGYLLHAGTPAALLQAPSSITAQYLAGTRKIPTPTRRRAPRKNQWLIVENASANNLRHLTARFPLGLFICVTGVSGSGKSTLVDDILRRALFQHFYHAKLAPGPHGRIRGLACIDHAIVIDQSPIGRTPRSNPATYTNAFAPIRALFASLPAAKLRGYAPGRFSFNVKGGRCEACKGDGVREIEMSFLPNVHVPCELCHGRRYNQETLEIRWKGKNIADVLNLTVSEALDFFAQIPQITRKFKTMDEVGLGYLRLGQPATTLSGGEAQRMKLSAELARKDTGRTVYLLDEPTTGLHFADVDRLLRVLCRLRDAGNTLIVIEHNLDVIKTADWILDLGPEGGKNGGTIVAQGPPEIIAACKTSHTGRFLAPLLSPTH